MLRLTEIRLGLEHTEAELRAAMLRALGIAEAELVARHVRRRGYDARRSGEIVFVYTLDVEVRDEVALLAKLHGRPHVAQAPDETYRYPVRAPASLAKRPVVIGTGPCGIFAGLSLARMGFRPIILERGRIVRERTHDVWGFWRERRLNPESNVQFGEGGAGTFSDGKLHTGIKDRGYRIRQILKDFVDCGAPAEIIYISKPHIGTLRLVKVVENLRHRIEELGGEIRFEARVTDIAIENGAVRGVTLANGAHIETDRVVLAVGHSARYLRDAARPGRAHRGEAVLHRLPHRAPAGPDQPLPPRAARRQSGARRRRLQTRAPRHQRPLGVQLQHVPRRAGGGRDVGSRGRGHERQLSHYSRNERNANAGIVVGILPSDFGSDHPLAGIVLQRQLEARAFELGGRNYNAPAQLVGDFLAGRSSTAVGAVIPSYTPGVTWTDLSQALPDYAIAALREAIPAFDRNLRGFARPDAVLTAVETRTSAPSASRAMKISKVRIPRVYFPPAKARALPAASSPPPWTG